jgi:hypothetical protein
MAVKAKAGLNGTIRKEPVHHKTTQGSGRGSRAKAGKKPYRGQGR